MKKFLIALSLLMGVASPVSAGCAWVLWETDVIEPSREIRAIVPLSAFETRQDCINEQTKKETLRDEVLGQKYRKEMDFTFSCLPDTVDPRGVKGK